MQTSGGGSRRFLLLLAVIAGLVAALVPVGAGAETSGATLVPRGSGTIDLGSHIGFSRSKEIVFDARGGTITPGAASTSAGYTVVSDGCNGVELNSGGRCTVMVRSDRTGNPGMRLGTVQIARPDGGLMASAPLSSRELVGTAVLVDHASPDGASNLAVPESVMVTARDNYLELTALMPDGSLRWAAKISMLDDGAFTARTHRGTTQKPFDAIRVVISNCYGTAGVLDIDEVSRNITGGLDKFVAYGRFNCGAGGITLAINFDASPSVGQVWVTPGSMDVGDFTVGEPSAGIVVANLTDQAVPITATIDTNDMIVKTDSCSGRSLQPGVVCVIEFLSDTALGDVSASVDINDGLATHSAAIRGFRSSLVFAWETSQPGRTPRTAAMSYERGDPSLLVGDDGVLQVLGNVRTSTPYDSNVGASLAPPEGEIFEAGLYTGLKPLVGRAASPGIDFGGLMACRIEQAEFEIREITWRPDGQLRSLDMDFRGSCFNGPDSPSEVFEGAIRYNIAGVTPLVHLSTLALNPTIEPIPPHTNIVELLNFGPSPVTVGTARIVDDAQLAYWIDDQTCVGAVLEPGDSCIVDIGFQPYGPAPIRYTADLTIDATSFFGPLSVDLTASHWVSPAVVAVPYFNRVGYWTLQGDGTITGFGEARNVGIRLLEEPIVLNQLEPTPMGRGYWILNGENVGVGGDAVDHGQWDQATLDAFRPGERTISISATPSGDGYWLFTTQGRVATFGDAKAVGDLLGFQLAGPIVDSTATPSGGGVYMLGSDGGVFALGDARFAGSIPQVLAGTPLAAPIVGLVPDPDGTGYWMVASDGGVFAFDAPFRGSIPGVLEPGTKLVAPIIGMVPYGNGYLLVASDGGVFNFSNRPFSGSLGGQALTSPVVSIAALPPTDDYALRPRVVTP